MIEFNFDVSVRESGEGGWVNFTAKVKNWPIAPGAKRAKSAFYLAYHLIEKRWARSKDYVIATEHHPELLDQILARVFGDE